VINLHQYLLPLLLAGVCLDLAFSFTGIQWLFFHASCQLLPIGYFRVNNNCGFNIILVYSILFFCEYSFVPIVYFARMPPTTIVTQTKKEETTPTAMTTIHLAG
jgi:hypothetical protein